MTLLSTEVFVPDQKNKLEETLHQVREEHCMTLGLYHEARGEPLIGQYAVGATILNRVRSSAYPNSVCGVVFQNAHKKYRCQFSFACDDISNKPTNIKSYLKMQRLAKTILAKKLAREAKFLGQKFQATIDDLTHYHREDVSPVWSKELKQISTLGAHVFFKSNRVTRRYAY
jgi:spore germination cell wall hydrolase CwlJ-like protein